jgi:predicted ATP-dependent protease
MLDPITAFATASAAFNFVKRAVEAGREIEDVGSQLGTWFGACADLKQHEEESRDPPLFKKLLYKGSVEQEAMENLMRRKKIEQQEKELRELIVYRFGVDAYREMMDERRQLRESRERTVVLQRRRRAKSFQNALAVVLILFIFAIPVAVSMWLFGKTD